MLINYVFLSVPKRHGFKCKKKKFIPQIAKLIGNFLLQRLCVCPYQSADVIETQRLICEYPAFIHQSLECGIFIIYLVPHGIWFFAKLRF